MTIDTCSLTFDDGPDAAWTPRVLDCLGNEGVRSTFFVMAGRASSHPALIERMLTGGHEVELHCVRHVRHSEMDEQALRRDTDEGLRALRVLDVKPRRWRAPYGIVTEATRRVAKDHRLQLVGWSADTEDWRGGGALEMHARVAERIERGAIVLLHDGIGPGARRPDCRATVELIPRLLETIRQRGLRQVPLSELVT